MNKGVGRKRKNIKQKKWRTEKKIVLTFLFSKFYMNIYYMNLKEKEGGGGRKYFLFCLKIYIC